MTDQPQDTAQQPPTYTGYEHPAARRRHRSREDKMIAGVCGGIARHFGIDPTLVRLIAVGGAVLGFGSLIVAYLVCWVVIPQE
ncbi:MAG: PspC domain-containing protein [Propionibacteriales bacterium]|nr:PspC domain-containing protein [Propionibacteriales bacterium]